MIGQIDKITVNSNLYHICHRLRGDDIRAFEILLTSIFDVKIESHGHEKHRRRLSGSAGLTLRG